MPLYDVLLGLRPVTEALDLLGARYFSTGAIACSIHGVGRAPLDIEQVTDLPPDSNDRLNRILGPRFGRAEPGVLVYSEERIPVAVRRARPSPISAAAFARAQRVPLDEATAYTAWVASAEDTVLDLLLAVAAAPRSGSQLWCDVMAVLKMQGDALDADYIHAVAAQAGLGGAWEELHAQRDTVPLSWDCPLEAEQRWLDTCRGMTASERFRSSRALAAGTPGRGSAWMS